MADLIPPVSPAERARRKSRRSSCAARELVGVSDDVAAALESDDDRFFGFDEEEHHHQALSAPDEHVTTPGAEDSDWSDADEEGQAELPRGNIVGDVGASRYREAETLLSTSCGCTRENHFAQFTPQQVAEFRQQLSSLSSRECDLYLLGVPSAGLRGGKQTHHGAHRAERERFTYMYSAIGKPVCRNAFMIICDIGRTRLARLQKEAEVGSCNPKSHGNVGVVPWNAFPQGVRDDVETFIKNYASLNGLPMPAAPRGRAQDAPTYLPASSSYKIVHGIYSQQVEPGRVVMSYKSFVRLWQDRLPSIQFMTSRTDVCDTCERFRGQISAATTEDGKLRANREFAEHIRHAQSERSCYTEAIDNARDALEEDPDDPTFSHLTFDFAENFVSKKCRMHPGSQGQYILKSCFVLMILG